MYLLLRPQQESEKLAEWEIHIVIAFKNLQTTSMGRYLFITSFKYENAHI